MEDKDKSANNDVITSLMNVELYNQFMEHFREGLANESSELNQMLSGLMASKLEKEKEDKK